jgi:hypothetical protein
MQPQIHLIDETWIDVPPKTVSTVVADRANWEQWWPDLTLNVVRDRGLKGMQWAASGRFQGTAEIWLEAYQSGVIMHHYLRLDPVPPRRLRRAVAARTTRRFAWHAKRVFWDLKDRLEAQRVTGMSTSAATHR